jgi:hypothetical protein
MRKLMSLSLCAGALVMGIGEAAASDVSVWRYTVSECLRAQQARDTGVTKLYHEASAFDIGPVVDRNGKPTTASDPLDFGGLKTISSDQSTSR